jgi:UMF1 family MFS transporter
MLTKFAHVLGPVLIGIVGFFFADPRFILIAILPLFVLGAIALTRVTTVPVR